MSHAPPGRRGRHALRALIALLAVVALTPLIGSACTPTRTTVDAPFRFSGTEYASSDDLAHAVGALCAPDTEGASPYPFTTDGCSMWPDGDWRACCLAHDVEYWCGGIAGNRHDADKALRQCVAETSGSVHAFFMYLGVRVGGSHLVPFGWRWGYGFDWPHRGRTDAAAASGAHAPVTGVHVEAAVAQETDQRDVELPGHVDGEAGGRADRRD